MCNTTMLNTWLLERHQDDIHVQEESLVEEIGSPKRRVEKESS